MDFKVGDKVFYPGHGVGEIKGIEKRNFAGRTSIHYIFRLHNTTMDIFIELSRAQSLRHLVSRDEVEAAFRTLASPSKSASTQSWNNLYRARMEKMRRGVFQDIVEVLRDLLLLARNKELSFAVGKIRDQAQDLFLVEAMLVLGQKKEEVQRRLDAAMAAHQTSDDE